MTKALRMAGVAWLALGLTVWSRNPLSLLHFAVGFGGGLTLMWLTWAAAETWAEQDRHGILPYLSVKAADDLDHHYTWHHDDVCHLDADCPLLGTRPWTRAE